MIERYVIRLKQSNQDGHWEGYVRTGDQDVFAEATAPELATLADALMQSLMLHEEVEKKGDEAK